MEERGLKDRGVEVYKALTERRDVSAAHRVMALSAARIADTLDLIELELALNPQLTVENSQGTITVNPLIAEARMLTGALSQILAKMGVSSLPEQESQEKSKLDELAERRAERAAARTSNTTDSLQSDG